MINSMYDELHKLKQHINKPQSNKKEIPERAFL